MRRRFGKTLEDKADQLAAEANIRQLNISIPGMLKREIAGSEGVKWPREGVYGVVRHACFEGDG